MIVLSSETRNWFIDSTILPIFHVHNLQKVILIYLVVYYMYDSNDGVIVIFIVLVL